MFLTSDDRIGGALAAVRESIESMPQGWDSIADLDERRAALRSGYNKDAWADSSARAQHIPLEVYFDAYNAFSTIPLPSPSASGPVWEVVLAIHARDYLDPEQYALLVTPWEAEFGPIDRGAPIRRSFARR
jgi:hypothetical protein